jgi:hypothetical protein
VAGKTSWREVSDLLGSLGLDAAKWVRADESVTYESGYQMTGDSGNSYNVSLTFFVDEGTVRRVDVWGEAYGGRSSELLAEDWWRHSLDKTLMRLGPPQAPCVWIIDPLEIGAEPFYIIELHYPEAGLSVSHRGPAVSDGGVLRACPRLSQAYNVRMSFVAPSSVGKGGTMHDCSRLTESIAIDAEAFYQLFRHSSEDVCVENPAGK